MEVCEWVREWVREVGNDSGLNEVLAEGCDGAATLAFLADLVLYLVDDNLPLVRFVPHGWFDDPASSPSVSVNGAKVNGKPFSIFSLDF